jgi:hypothetical protein
MISEFKIKFGDSKKEFGLLRIYELQKALLRFCLNDLI